MKKKLLSALMFGALFVASASLTSCKDYDDDIQANTEQIQKLTSEVSSLNAALATCKSECQAQIQAAVTDYTSKIAAAKADLQAAIDKKADATTVSALAEKVAGLETEYRAKIASLESRLNDIDTAIANLNATLQTKVDKTAFDEAIAQLQAALGTKANQSDLDAANAIITDIKTRVEKIEGDYLTAADKLELLNKIETLATKADVQAEIAKLNEAINGKVSTADFEAFKQAYTEAMASYTTWAGDVNTKLADLKTADEEIATKFGDSLKAQDLAIKDLQVQLQALNNFFGAIGQDDFQTTLNNLKNSLTAEANAKYAALTERIDSVRDVLKATQDDVKATNVRIDTLSSYLNKNFVTITKLNQELATMTTLINRKLTSLVLKPAFYFGGIEAVEVPTLQNYKAYTATKGLTIDETWAAAGNTVNISMGGVATYHVNPAIADLAGYTLDFYGNDPVTRAGIQYVTPVYNTFEKLIAADSKNFAAGLIHVPFTVDYAKVNATKAEGKTPMIAFQMSKTEKDGSRTVTSDYALLNITDYKNLILADNATTGADDHTQQIAADLQHNHIFGQVAGQVVKDLAPEAILPTHEIEYDGSLDLNKIVETHYTYSNSATGTVTSDQLMDANTFKALGLSYQFDLIPYTLTGRTKAENTYVTLKDGVVTPNKDDVQSAKGHMPLVRVLLKDSKGNVLKVGYIKLKVAGVTEPVASATFTGPKAVTCTGVAFNNVTIAKVEQDLYTDPRIDMTKAEFNATYSLDAANGVAKQFVLKNTGFVAATAPIGTVTTTATNFVWTLSNAITDTMSVDAKGANKYPFVTYVHYTNSGNLNAYVKLTIPAGAIVKPVPTVDNSNKVLARWYLEDGKAQTGTADQLSEIHVNPEVVGQAGADDEIYYDMLNGFLNKEVKFKFPTSTFTSANVTDFQFVFITKPGTTNWIVYGKSGNSYQLKVSADGTKLFATTKTVAANSSYPKVTNEEIATLSGAHNSIITYNTKAQAQYLAAYDILNKNGHNELADGQTFKAYIGVQAEIDDCNWLNAGKFTVRFLRPVDLKTTSAEPAKDAVDGGYYVDLKNLFETPTDWRDQWVNSGANNYWTYYGITSIEADVTKAFTDAAKPVEKRTPLAVGFEAQSQIEALATVANANVQFSYIAPDAKHTFGQLLYTNNNATITDFHIYVPITVTYDWGYKVTMGYARIDVKFTQNNAKRQ